MDFVIKTSIKKALSKVSEDSNAHVVLKKQLDDLYFMIDTNLLYRSRLVDHRVRTVLKTMYKDEETFETLETNAKDFLRTGYPQTPIAPDNNAPKKKDANAFFKYILKDYPTNIPNLIQGDEITRIMDDKGSVSSINPLKWWDGKDEYPSLFKMAKEFLCIQGTCRPLEEIFTWKKEEVEDRLRHRLRQLKGLDFECLCWVWSTTPDK